MRATRVRLWRIRPVFGEERSTPSIKTDSDFVVRIVSADPKRPPSFSIRWLTSSGIVNYSANEFIKSVKREKQALSTIGITKGDKVGVRGENSYLWMVTDVALAELEAVSVVFPSEFTKEPPSDLMCNYGLRFFLLSDEAPPMEYSGTDIAIMGQIDTQHHAARFVTNDPYPVTGDDHSFVFSSGTSGAFKGMVISKKGVLDQIKTFGAAVELTSDDSILLFMPFTSNQNRVLYYCGMMNNAELAVVSPHQILDGLKKLEPTLLIAPPIFYEAVEKSARAALRKKGAFTLLALNTCRALINMFQSILSHKTRKAVLGRLFQAAHNIFGPRMRVMVTGMAKIGLPTLEFYDQHGLPMIQVYGLTESGVVCVNSLADNKIGTVGKPLPGNDITIADDGEIFVKKSAPQTSRFFHFEPSNEDTRFADGGVYTGDLGQISGDGTLTLVGRKKSTIVGHTGVKIQPEPIEKKLEENALVSTAVLVGLDRGRKLGIAVRASQKLSKTEQISVEKNIQKSVGNSALSYKNHIEIAFSDEDFTAENGLLTRNLKINRNAVQQRFFEGPQHA